MYWKKVEKRALQRCISIRLKEVTARLPSAPYAQYSFDFIPVLQKMVSVSAVRITKFTAACKEDKSLISSVSKSFSNV
jgi:hypothetical protein